MTTRTVKAMFRHNELYNYTYRGEHPKFNEREPMMCLDMMEYDRPIHTACDLRFIPKTSTGVKKIPKLGRYRIILDWRDARVFSRDWS